GGGHGHPDRLNILLANDNRRWLDDYGTGSYVDPSLHWYRSTLAHNAPIVNRASQRAANGRLVAYDERGGAGWIEAAVDGVASGVRLSRTIVVMSEYAIDELWWQADADATVDLPLHADIAFDAGISALEPAWLDGSRGVEDGFRFVHDATMQRAAPNAVVHGEASHGASRLRVWTQSNRPVEWWRVVAPGPPGGTDRAFRMVRCVAGDGRYRTVFAWASSVTAVDFDDGGSVRVTFRDETSHVHSRTEGGWRVDFRAGSARSSIDLEGRTGAPATAGSPPPDERAAEPIPLPADGRIVRLPLGEPHYRRSEQSWRAAGAPSATLSLSWHDGALRIAIDVRRSDLTFASAASTNRYDNEHPDINGDSMQLYLLTDRGRSAWMLVPDAASSDVRIRPLDGWTDPAAFAASWRREGRGYHVDAEVSGARVRAIDVIVNEMPAGRERRRGQLVLSGGGGEFVYLRGDRHDVGRLVPLQIPDV
ncbi:MAG TPA: heparinase II/III family protein, partial [Gemmatimonadaceae bacterium]|nr:heparinase II/III family protein [Gemmatimonadaceae bacterium]